MSKNHYQIVIIGGGTAGITVAARLMNKDKSLDIVIIEPATKHYYQAAWTLVGAGAESFESTEHNMKDLIPHGVTWLKDSVVAIDADNNNVTTAENGTITYDYLVPCPGIKIDPTMVEGLAETMGKNNVCSNYVNPNYTWEVLQNFKGGQMVFTQADTPIKCGAGPQKIMYLAEEYLQKHHLRDKSSLVFAHPGSIIFGVDGFRERLLEINQEKHIHLRFFHQLTKIDGEARKAYYKINLASVKSTQKPVEYYRQANTNVEVLDEAHVVIPFDFLHLAPPQRVPDCIRDSKLVGTEGASKGWVEVDIHTLQHKRYPNVFGLGDSAALPTAKTGAAIRKQAPVLVENLYHLIKGNQKLTGEYHGYSACPIVTGYGKMLLAEFGYDNVPMPDPMISTFVNTQKEHYSMWILKKYGLPFFYWNGMMKGLM